MIRFLLNAFFVLLLARLVFWIARLFLSRGQGPAGTGHPMDGPDRMEGMGLGERKRRGSARLDRSSAVDVPFTEVPPEGASVPRKGAPPPREAP
jgi:hypothetical protein